MKILISAAEASSDAHGAELLRALQATAPAGEKLEAFGIGGPKLQAAGLRIVVDAKELLSMGFSEVLGKLPRIVRSLNKIKKAAVIEKPDVAILIDYPDFHFKLAKKLLRYKIPLVYYIPPKVWVWRASRTEKLKKYFRKVLCIFPFEEEFLKSRGVDAAYVGNPLLDELPLGVSKESARKRLGLSADETFVVLMPGSRPAELKRHFEVMLDAVLLSAQKLERKLVVSIPLAETTSLKEFETRKLAWQAKQATHSKWLDLKLTSGNSSDCLLAANAALVKSGTSTLEAALLGCPHCVVYRTGWSTSFIYKHLIRYRGPVGLVNLAGGWKQGDPYLAKEILLEQVTASSLSAELNRLLTDTKAIAAMQEDFTRLREKLMQGGKERPSIQAAQEVWEVISKCSPA